MRQYIEKNGLEDNEKLIRYAYLLVQKYGEASAALSAEMYDAIAILEGVNVPAAVPAYPATYPEVAKAVNGTATNEEILSNAVGRLVKMAGQDTTLRNSLRDGAEFAWIPQGETCAFCLTLASRGWQKASKNALKNGHAEHIHANCDCAYAIRFSSDNNVAGYNPDRYLKMYYDAPLKDGQADTPQNRINALRRQLGANN